MARRPSHAARRSRADYTALLNELQKRKPADSVSETAASQPPAPKAKPASAPPSISPFRQRLMSDEGILYFYSQAGDVIHDKTCRAARLIPDEALRWSDSYRPDLMQCPDCRLKAYLRLGARDASRTAAYEKLFETMGFSEKLLRRMYVHDGIQTEIIGPDRLKLWGNEDVWLLELLADRKSLRLLHNNYCALPDGGRSFVPGFHEQAAPATAEYAVSVIAGYTYEKHKAAAAKRNVCSGNEASFTPTQQHPNVWLKLWNWLRALFGKRP